MWRGPRRRQPPVRRPVAFISAGALFPGMADILAENLSGKAVMGADGTELGDLYNITMELKTGQLHHLLVTPRDRLDPGRVSFDTDDQGRIQVPVGAVQAVKDYIVVDR